MHQVRLHGVLQRDCQQDPKGTRLPFRLRQIPRERAFSGYDHTLVGRIPHGLGRWPYAEGREGGLRPEVLPTPRRSRVHLERKGGELPRFVDDRQEPGQSRNLEGYLSAVTEESPTVPGIKQ